MSASYNHSGVSRETTREQDGILLPFFYLTYYLRCTLISGTLQLSPRDRSGESAKGKWRTHDPIFSGLIKCLGLENTFSSSPPVATQNNEQV